MQISLHSQKLLSIKSHFAKCTASSKYIRRSLSTLFLFIWSLRNRFIFSKRITFKLQFKWYIITHCSRSGWNIYMRFEFKGCMLGNCPECLKRGLSLSDFKAYVDLISFLQWQRVEKRSSKLIKQGYSIKWFPNGWQPKKNYIYKKREQVVSYYKQKGELKTGEALIGVDYSNSYNKTQQDEIQSSYFVQQNFSIFVS